MGEHIGAIREATRAYAPDGGRSLSELLGAPSWARADAGSNGGCGNSPPESLSNDQRFCSVAILVAREREPQGEPYFPKKANRDSSNRLLGRDQPSSSSSMAALSARISGMALRSSTSPFCFRFCRR